MASHQSYARVGRRHMRVTDYHVFARGCTRKAGTGAPHAKRTQSDKPIRVPVKNDHGWAANQDAPLFSLFTLCMRGMQI